ncbi:MAG: hypothetical protein KDE20_04060, partial [Caldilineaceae bacterium]|nr:hypothetical protein [Caldilineaceae bacterium]
MPDPTMSDQPEKPAWTPDDAGDAFAARVLRGVVGGHDGMTPRAAATSAHGTRRGLTLDAYVDGVLRSDRTVLARAITLVESNAPAHLDDAQELLRRLLPHTGHAMRIGITGVPGA